MPPKGLAAVSGYSGLALLDVLPLNTSMTMVGAFMLLIRVRRLRALTLFARRVPGCEMTLGGFPETTAPGVELVVMSPGVSPYFGAAASVCASARKAGIPIVGEIELFAQELAYLKRTQGYAPKVIGITGTNGKTTTTTLTTKMAAAAGLYAVAAGNIGPNAVAELSKAEVAGALPDIWVLELSSFQLETTHTLNCTSAALLNITEDHLDWHGSIEAYAHAKGRIFCTRYRTRRQS